jgi:hypothetical protein
MAGSVLSYRVFRLRRLIGVCLGLLATGIAGGMWLVPGSSALQVVFGLGLFSVFAMAHLALILLWPRDVVEPLISALGFAAVLAVGLPIAAAHLGTGTETAVIAGLLLLFSPVIWMWGIRLLGWAMLMPLDHISRRNITLTVSQILPLPMDAARDCFFVAPHQKRRDSVTGPVEWDGFLVETTTVRRAGPALGQITSDQIKTRMRILEQDAHTQGVLVQMNTAAGQPPTTLVLHQTLTAQGTGTGTGTRLDRRFGLERVAVSELVTGWLGDLQCDSITALADQASGHPPRAICEDPYDGLALMVDRWLANDKPQPGG